MENFLYFIGGIIITTIIGVITTKWGMKKNKIIHFSINSYDIGKGLKNDFPEFQLHYDGENLSNNVMVLKGGFVNSGRNDIIGLKNKSDFKMILPNECSLKDIKIKQLSDDLEVKACKSEDASNIINFSVNEKFMSGEGFEYTAIIETTEEIKNLHRKIDFKHRIPNTSKITNEYIGQQMRKESPLDILFPSMKKEKAMGIISFVGTFILCIFSLSCFFAQRVQYSVIEKGTNKEYSLYLAPQSKLYISDNKLLPLWGNKTITKSELDKKYSVSIKTKYSFKNDEFILGIFITLMTLFYIFCTITSFYLWSKKKRIYHFLEQYEQE